MDPYYQQQQQPSGQQQQQPGIVQGQAQQQHQQVMQQQPQQQAGYHSQRTNADFGAPPAPQQMVGPPGQQQQAPLPPPLGHHQQQQQQQPQHQSSSSGGHHRSHHHQSQQQQQQQLQQPYNQQGLPQQQQAYGSMEATQQPAGLSQTHGRHSSGHGGQAPLPPGHHPSAIGVGVGGGGGRYGPSHRSAMLHQHRSSAAAISDPMMAGGITDQLASASGPLSGSQSALNQIGYGQQYPYQQQQQQEPGGYHGFSGGGHHQSRYDNHYNPGSGRRHYSHNQPPAHQGYDPMLVGGELGARSVEPATMLGGGAASARYLSQPTGALHQSLANLPSAGAAKYQAGYADLHPSERAYYGLDPLGAPTTARAGSMPPQLASLDYNPSALDRNAGFVDAGLDPLLPSDRLQQQQMHGARQLAAGGLDSAQFGLGPVGSGFTGQPNSLTYAQELRARLAEIQGNYASVKRELETATQKLGSTMHSIKTFWSPELKKERALRKEEATKYALINDQMKLMRVEVQVSCLFHHSLCRLPLSGFSYLLIFCRLPPVAGNSHTQRDAGSQQVFTVLASDRMAHNERGGGAFVAHIGRFSEWRAARSGGKFPAGNEAEPPPPPLEEEGSHSVGCRLTAAMAAGRRAG